MKNNMSADEDFFKTTLRKRTSSIKAEICNLIEKQTQGLQEAGAQLIWKRTSEDSLKYDVVMVFPPKGFYIIDPLLQMLNERLPNLIIDIKPHAINKEQAFYITANNDYLLSSAKLLGYECTQTLTSLQRQSIILHSLNSLRWITSRNKSQFIHHEFTGLKFNEGDAVISNLIELKLIKQVLPLHNECDLSALRSQWVSSVCSPQPLDKICEYFGIKIAVYFAFLGYYTIALVFPAVFGLLITVIGENNIIGDVSILAFTVFNIIWGSVFLQRWKRSNKKVVQNWSSTHFGTTVNFVRPLFRGNLIHVNTFGRLRIIYPEWKRKLFKYFITFPVICICLLSVFVVMLSVFRLQTWFDNVLINQKHYPQWTSYLPKILLAVIVNIFESIYYQIAVWLNNKENYQYETAHENNLILKLIPFQFVNGFLPLFYIAFFIGDMDKLREQLAALLIIRQVIGNIKEALWPFVVEAYKLSFKINHNINQVELETSMFRYDSTFDDYLEIVIQFGYVILFSSTFPLAALCALINNIIEIRSDAFKLCVVYQRPFGGDNVKDIGEWQSVMNYLLYAAIVVNCALIAKSKQISKIFPITEDVHVILFSILIEHFLIAMQWLTPFIA